MPDFDVRVISGTTSLPWDDRHLSHRSANVHRYRVVRPPVAGSIAQVVLHAVVGGVVAPLDAALGGRLIIASRVQWAGTHPFTITQAAGQSSAITLGFSATMLGHQELCLRRDDGGSIILSFEVEPDAA